MADTPPVQPTDNTSPEEKELADKLMAELKASGVDVNALQAKTAAASPSTPTPPPPSPAPVAPAPTPVTPPPPSPLEDKTVDRTDLSVDEYIQSLDQKLSRLNDETFWVIRIPKVWFYLLVTGVIVFIWFKPWIFH